MRKLLAGTLLLVALAVAGCGGGSSSSGNGGSDNGEASKSGTQVVKDTVKAAEAASSFHMSGDINTGAQKISLDLSIETGKGAEGSMSLAGQKVDLIVVGGNAYMKAGSAFWSQFGGSQGSAIAQLVADKWFKFPTSNPQFSAFTGFTNPKGLFDSLGSTSGPVTNKGATTYKGQKVVKLFGGTSNGNLYVSATGTPYPLALVKTGAGSSGSITFDKWGESVSLTAPSGAIDISQLHP